MESVAREESSSGAELLSDHGMHVYTTPDSPGFLATFKSQLVLLVFIGAQVDSICLCRPEDFVVTEINSKEQPVVLDGYDVPPLPPLSEFPVSGKRRRLYEPGSSRPDPDSVPPLQDLVTPQQYHALTQLSQSYKSTLVADPDHRVDFGRQ